MNSTVLREVIRHPGPFASVYLDFSHDTEDAARQLRLKWESARAELAELGADERTTAALEQAFGEHTPAEGRGGLALIAADGDVLVDEELPEPPATPVVRRSPLPFVLPLHKVPDGGWSHRSMHRRVEATVKRNAETVVAKRRDRLLEEYQADAEQGLTAALREANAETLVVAPGVLESRTVWCSPTSPAQLGVDDRVLRGLGLPDLAEVPAAEALPAAAIAVGAIVVIAPVGMELADGVGVRPRHGPG